MYNYTCCCLEVVLDLFCLPLEFPPPIPCPVAPLEEELEEEVEEEPRPLSFESMMALTCSVMESRERPERVFLLLRRTSWRTLLKSSLQGKGEGKKRGREVNIKKLIVKQENCTDFTYTHI